LEEGSPAAFRTWVTGERADWTVPYYHHADAFGLGFDRTATGSNALGQYAPELVAKWGDLATCRDNLLLWFHNLPSDYRMRSGRTLWDELCLDYQRGSMTSGSCGANGAPWRAPSTASASIT
jgi:alpha-glucuronidase